MYTELDVLNSDDQSKRSLKTSLASCSKRRWYVGLVPKFGQFQTRKRKIFPKLVHDQLFSLIEYQKLIYYRLPKMNRPIDYQNTTTIGYHWDTSIIIIDCFCPLTSSGRLFASSYATCCWHPLTGIDIEKHKKVNNAQKKKHISNKISSG